MVEGANEIYSEIENDVATEVVPSSEDYSKKIYDLLVEYRNENPIQTEMTLQDSSVDTAFKTLNTFMSAFVLLLSMLVGISFARLVWRKL